MKVYTEQEVIDLVGKREDVNFLAAAITPWHAIGIDATILKLTEQGIILKGYIMLVAHSITGVAIDENNFHMATTHKVPGIEVIQVSPDTIRRSFLEKIKVKWNLYSYYFAPASKEKKDTLYWVVPYQPSYDLIPRMNAKLENRRIQIILTDEGTGSYTMNVWKWWRYHFMEGGLKATRNILIRNPLFLHLLKTKNQIVQHQLLMGKAGHLEMNQEISKYYEKIFTFEKFEEDYSVYENSVLINSNMLQQSGIIEGDAEINTYKRVCEYLQEIGLSAVIKPHPRELHLEKYAGICNCYIEKRKGIAQETILAKLQKKPYCVVGFSSTTLITAKALFGVEAISLNYLLDSKCIKNKSFFRTFNKTFANLVYMPKTMAEFEHHMEQIQKCK